MIHEIQEGYVKTEMHQGVTTIEFFHPQGNSLPYKILDELAKSIHVAGHDDECRVIVLRSAGEGVFCSGASFDEMANIKTEAEGVHFFSGFANVINAMRKCPRVIIVRVQGKCIGGGVGLVAACDYAIAVSGADVRLSELAIGIGPFVVGPVIERKINTAAFSQLAIDAASWRSSDWAKRRNLYAELHPDITSMDEAILKLSIFLTHTNPKAITTLKNDLWKGTEHWDEFLHERAAISSRLVLSEFSKNAIAAFKQKMDARSKHPAN
ncbi:enoyl-CoA hydratase/isomerase family protein [Parafilimonas sp.]|uniref:enoyl-CoA hydratase/isomerase family protein n=1 Tax=Parafilimonas sp. TaxID=1969739 RepID=UPI0039E67207